MYSKLFLLILITVTINWFSEFVYCLNSTEENNNNENITEIRYRWEKDFVDVLPVTLPMAILNSNNRQCVNDSVLFVNSLKNLTTWAYEIWDASAKSTAGQISGSNFNIGHFEQCLDVNAPFETKFCLVDVELHFELPNKKLNKYSLDYDPNDTVLNYIYYKGDKSQFRRDIATFGLCIPDSCSHNDLEESLNQYFESMEKTHRYNVTYVAKIIPQYCQSKNSRPQWDGYDIGFCIFTISLIALTIIGTYVYRNHDVTINGNEEESFVMKFLKYFSIKNNYRSLVYSDNETPHLKHLNGMKVFAIVCVITDHALGTTNAGMTINPNYAEKWLRSFEAIFFVHGEVFVDTFFLISALLATYCLLMQFQKKIINAFFIIISRYMRLTPLFAFVVFFYATLLYRLGEGPQWELIVGGEKQACRESWWASILYINNYVKDTEMCMVQSWYLPCDMHFFILGVFLILILHKNPRIGLILLVILTIVSIAIPFSITYYYRKSGVLHFYPGFVRDPRHNDVFQTMYIKSHTRASPYFIGILTGYIIFKVQKKNYNLTKMATFCYFAASLILTFSVLLAGYVFYIPEIPYNVYTASIYSAFHRVVWSIGTSLFIISLGFGKFKFLYNILASKFLMVLSKLTYGTYLVHMIFMFIVTGSAKTLSVNSRKLLIEHVIFYSCVSFLTAFVLYFILEAPLRYFFKDLIFPPKKRNNNSPDMKSNLPVLTKEIFTIKTNL